MQVELEKPFEEQLEDAISQAIPFEDYQKFAKGSEVGGVAGSKLVEHILAEHSGAILRFPADDDMFIRYYQIATRRLKLPLSMLSKHLKHEQSHRDSLLNEGVKRVNYAFVFAFIRPAKDSLSFWPAVEVKVTDETISDQVLKRAAKTPGLDMSPSDFGMINGKGMIISGPDPEKTDIGKPKLLIKKSKEV